MKGLGTPTADLKIEEDGYGGHTAVTSSGRKYSLREERGGIRISADYGLINLEPEAANSVRIVERPKS